MEEMTVAKI
jgi:hypothetical protein